MPATVNHTISIATLSLDGVVVLDSKRPQGLPPQQLNKIKAIASFSRNKRTETTSPSRPLVPGRNDRKSLVSNKVRYMTLWEKGDSGAEDEGNRVVLETNLHRSKKARSGFDFKSFEVVVGLIRGDTTSVLGVSILNINGPTDGVLEFDLPLCPLGMETMQEFEDVDDGMSVGVSSFIMDREARGANGCWKMSPLVIDGDFGRQYKLAKNASMKVGVQVINSMFFYEEKMRAMANMNHPISSDAASTVHTLNKSFATGTTEDDEYTNVSSINRQIRRNGQRPPRIMRPNTHPVPFIRPPRPAAMKTVGGSGSFSVGGADMTTLNGPLTIYDGGATNPYAQVGVSEFSVFTGDDPSALGDHLTAETGENDYSHFSFGTGKNDAQSMASGPSVYDNFSIDKGVKDSQNDANRADFSINEYGEDGMTNSQFANYNSAMDDDFTLTGEYETQRGQIYGNRSNMGFSVNEDNAVHEMDFNPNFHGPNNSRGNGDDDYSINVGNGPETDFFTNGHHLPNNSSNYYEGNFEGPKNDMGTLASYFRKGVPQQAPQFHGGNGLGGTGGGNHGHHGPMMGTGYGAAVSNEAIFMQDSKSIVPNGADSRYQSNEAIFMVDSQSLAAGGHPSQRSRRSRQGNGIGGKERSFRSRSKSRQNTPESDDRSIGSRLSFGRRRSRSKSRQNTPESDNQSLGSRRSFSRRRPRSKSRQSTPESDDQSIGSRLSFGRRRSRSKSRQTTPDSDNQSLGSRRSFGRRRSRSKSRQGTPESDDQSHVSGRSMYSRASRRRSKSRQSTPESDGGRSQKSWRSLGSRNRRSKSKTTRTEPESESDEERSAGSTVASARQRSDEETSIGTEYTKDEGRKSKPLYDKLMDGIFGEQSKSIQSKASEATSSSGTPPTPPQSVRIKSSRSIARTEITNFTQDSWEKWEKSQNYPVAFGGNGLFNFARPNSRQSRQRSIQGIPLGDEYTTVGRVLSIRANRPPRRGIEEDSRDDRDHRQDRDDISVYSSRSRRRSRSGRRH